MPYEQEETSPEMIAYYEDQRKGLEQKVKDGDLIEKKFDDGTILYTSKLNEEEIGFAVSVNGLIIISGDMVRMKQFSPISKIINKDPSENIKDIIVRNFATNYYKTGIDFVHHPNYLGDNMKLTEIAENITANGRQQKLARLRQRQMAVHA